MKEPNVKRSEFNVRDDNLSGCDLPFKTPKKVKPISHQAYNVYIFCTKSTRINQAN